MECPLRGAYGMVVDWVGDTELTASVYEKAMDMMMKLGMCVPKVINKHKLLLGIR